MQRFFLLALSVATASLCTFGQTPVPAGIFGINGCADIAILPTSTSFKSHAVQSDGKLLLAGWGGDGFPYRVAMARIDTSCGELDPTFGEGGILTHHFQARTICHSIAVLSDGKIVGGGVIANGNSSSGQFPAVFRYNSDGSVDSTFNGTGFNNTGFSSGQSAGTVQDLFIDAEGRILAAVMGYAKMGVFRYLPDGTLDTTYSGDGRAEMPVAYTPFPDVIAGVMDPNGSVTVAGLVGTGPFETTHMALARFLPDGDPDLSFGSNGLIVHPTILTTSGPDGFEDWSIVRRPGGGYLVGYGVQLSVTSPSVAAFAENGSVDVSYATDGFYHFTDENAAGSGLHMDPDGSALLFIKYNSNSGPGAIVKLTPGGQQDPDFGTNGVLLAPFGQSTGRGFVDGFRMAGGDIITYGGSGNADAMVARFSLDVEANAVPVITYEYPALLVSGAGTIQWFLDGAPISGATGSTHTPEQNGTYTVEMNSFGCAHTSPPFAFLSTDLVENVRTGLTFGQDLSAGVIMVRNDGAPIAWSLIDASGRELRSGAFLGGTTELSVAHLRSGLYFLLSKRSVHRFVMP